ncbi:MAG: hypothetical protein WCI76_02995, partial [bacterium]
MEGFPKYLMRIDEKLMFMSLQAAAAAFDNGFVKVDFGRYVLNADDSVTKMRHKVPKSWLFKPPLYSS